TADACSAARASLPRRPAKSSAGRLDSTRRSCSSGSTPRRSPASARAGPCSPTVAPRSTAGLPRDDEPERHAYLRRGDRGRPRGGSGGGHLGAHCRDPRRDHCRPARPRRPRERLRDDRRVGAVRTARRDRPAHSHRLRGVSRDPARCSAQPLRDRDRVGARGRRHHTALHLPERALVRGDLGRDAGGGGVARADRLWVQPRYHERRATRPYLGLPPRARRYVLQVLYGLSGRRGLGHRQRLQHLRRRPALRGNGGDLRDPRRDGDGPRREHRDHRPPAEAPPLGRAQRPGGLERVPAGLHGGGERPPRLVPRRTDGMRGLHPPPHLPGVARRSTRAPSARDDNRPRRDLLAVPHPHGGFARRTAWESKPTPPQRGRPGGPVGGDPRRRHRLRGYRPLRRAPRGQGPRHLDGGSGLPRHGHAAARAPRRGGPRRGLARARRGTHVAAGGEAVQPVPAQGHYRRGQRCRSGDCRRGSAPHGDARGTALPFRLLDLRGVGAHRVAGAGDRPWTRAHAPRRDSCRARQGTVSGAIRRRQTTRSAGMKFGLKLNTQFTARQDPVKGTQELLDQVRAARDNGFDSVWVSQHYLATPYLALQTWPMLGRVVAEAGDMVVGTSIFLFTLLNPVYAAEHAATMDILTGGRFVFGIGLGYRPEEFEAFGVSLERRGERFEECLDVMLRLWTEPEVDHHGTYFSLTNARLTLRPVQRPHPPVWMAASGDAAVRRAARYGFPWLVNPHASLTQVAKQRELYLRTLREHGHDVPE